MNLDNLKDSGIVRLRPPARTERANGEFEDSDDEWRVERVDKAAKEVGLYNMRRGVRITLKPDHIHGYTSDPVKTSKGEDRGFLSLVRIEVKITANNSWSVEPLPVVREKKTTPANTDAGARLSEAEEKILVHLAGVKGFTVAGRVAQRTELSMHKVEFYLVKLTHEDKMLETPPIVLQGHEMSYKLGHYGRGYLLKHGLIE